MPLGPWSRTADGRLVLILALCTLSPAQLPPFAQQRGPVRVRVTPPDMVLATSGMQQYNAFVGFFTGTGQAGGERNETAYARWSSSNTTLATINANTGLATASSLATNTGVTSVRMQAGPFAAAVPLQINTVATATVTGVTVTPSSPTIPLGRGLPLTAMATYADLTTHDVTQTATWGSNATGVATVNAQGGVKSVSQGGPATITANFGAQNGTSSVTVSAPVLASREIVPFRPNLDLGSSQQIQLLDTQSNASVVDQTAAATWVSTDATIASVSNASGRNGFVTGAGKGTVSISATLGGTMNVPVTVNVPKPRFAYCVNVADKTISIYSVDAVTGKLTNIGFQPLTATPGPLTIEPKGRFLYVPLSSGALNGFKIDIGSGLLTAVPGSPFAVGALPKPLVADPTARFLYATTLTGFQGFSINQATGALAAAGSAQAMSTASPNTVTLDPSAKFAYVVHGSMAGPNTVDGYTLNQSTGAATVAAGSPFGTTGSGSNGLSIDAAGKFAYMSNLIAGYISIFSINGSTGALTQTGTASAAPGATAPSAVTVDPTGHYVYVSNSTSGNVSAFSINAGSGALTQIGANIAAGTTPSGLTVDPQGQFLYVTNSGSNDVSRYSINGGSGALTGAGTTNAQAGVTGMTILNGDPVTLGSNYAYVGNLFSDNISAFSQNTTTGALTPIPGSPFATLGSNSFMCGNNNPNCEIGSPLVVVDPQVKFAYVANRFSMNISGFNIDPATGALTMIGGFPYATGQEVHAIGIHPSGKYFYALLVPGAALPYIQEFTVNSGGQFTAFGAPVTVNCACNGTRRILFDPSGNYLYTGFASGGSGRIVAYSVNQGTGALTVVPGSPFASSDTDDISIDPSGKFLYTATRNVFGAPPFPPGQISSYSINVANGSITPTPFGVTSTPSSFGAISLQVDPGGRFLYVGITSQLQPDGPGTLTTYSINRNTGDLTNIGQITTNGFDTLAIDPSNAFAYLLLGFIPVDGTDNIQLYTTNPTGGLLTFTNTTFPTSGSGSAGMTITRAIH